MEALQRIPIFGDIPSLSATFLETTQSPPDLLVKSYTPYRRFAVRAADNGLDTFGLREGSYAVFREQRWPTQECTICLIRFGEDVTMRLFEGLDATMVRLRVSGDKIAPMELAPTDFTVIGVLDGVILQEFATLAEVEEMEFDWGC